MLNYPKTQKNKEKLFQNLRDKEQKLDNEKKMKEIQNNPEFQEVKNG